MPAQTVNAVDKSGISPEVQEAFESVKLPEVQDLMRQLSRYNLGVCVPHMHLANLDFAELPDDMVQVETNGVVSWVPRDQLSQLTTHVPVAWRWARHGDVEQPVITANCAPTENGHWDSDTGKTKIMALGRR